MEASHATAVLQKLQKYSRFVFVVVHSLTGLRRSSSCNNSSSVIADTLARQVGFSAAPAATTAPYARRRVSFAPCLFATPAAARPRYDESTQITAIYVVTRDSVLLFIHARSVCDAPGRLGRRVPQHLLLRACHRPQVTFSLHLLMISYRSYRLRALFFLRAGPAATQAAIDRLEKSVWRGVRGASAAGKPCLFVSVSMWLIYLFAWR